MSSTAVSLVSCPTLLTLSCHHRNVVFTFFSNLCTVPNVLAFDFHASVSLRAPTFQLQQRSNFPAQNHECFIRRLFIPLPSPLSKPSKFSQSLPPLLPGRKTAKQQNTACSNVWHIQVIPQQPGEHAGTRLQHKLRLRRIKRRSLALASFSFICFHALFPGRL